MPMWVVESIWNERAHCCHCTEAETPEQAVQFVRDEVADFMEKTIGESVLAYVATVQQVDDDWNDVGPQILLDSLEPHDRLIAAVDAFLIDAYDRGDHRGEDGEEFSDYRELREALDACKKTQE